MRLTKIEINGFKSFAKKTEIEVEKGITAIIGPNGCGKSNIADAVRWVLGEQSARALRGNRMEDVIFNGTEQLRPMSLCEVSLVFDNADGRLPTDFAEVSVTRRVYRSGESEYLINRAPCRLRDINELFRDTGIGRDGYSIIGQGRVEEILSNRSGDRRSAFEEAAGVMKYRVRREEAERRLENTRKNLVRINDILEELGGRIGPLEEQSAAARQYLKLRDELKETEVNIFLYQYDKLNERIANLRDGMEECSGLIEKYLSAEAAAAAGCSAEEERERALSGAIDGIQSRLLDASSGVESSAGEAKVARERMANLARERERLDEDMRAGSERREALEKEIAAAREESGKNSAKREEESKALESAESKRAELEEEIGRREEVMESRKNSMIEAMNRLSDAKSRISRLEAIRTGLTGRRDEIEARRRELEAEGEKLSREYGEVYGGFAAMKENYDKKAALRAEAAERLRGLNSEEKRVGEELRRVEKQTESFNSRLKVLNEMKRAHEGYYSSVRNLLRDSGRDGGLGRCVEGVVAELIRVPREYETAIEMALGPALQNIVTPTEQDGKRVIEYLRLKQYGRATMLPVSAMRPRLLSQRERDMCGVEGFIGAASELVGFDERYRGIFENLLGRTVIVRDLDAGIAINRQARAAFRIATLKGDIINPGGSMTGGSVQKREFSLIGREREIEALALRIKDGAALLDSLRAEQAEIEGGIALASGEAERVSEELHAMDVELAAQREKVDAVLKYADDNKRDMERSEMELGQIRDNIDNVDEQCREADKDRVQWEQGNVATQYDIRKMQEELYALRGEYAKANDLAAGRRVSMMALEKEFSAVQGGLRRMGKEASALDASLRRSREEAEACGRRLSELRLQAGSLDESVAAGHRDVDELTGRLKAMEEERANRLRAIDGLRARRESVRSDLADVRERAHRAELNLNRSQLELKNMQDRIWNDYELTYENALPMRKQASITAAHMRVDELRSAIKELGNVNVGAIEDCRAVKERYDGLSAQYEDLTKAENDLQVLISDLVSTMEEEFRRQFALIQRNFSEVFAELFGGGRAELVLSDKDDILNCDIDITAQPPGKKLQLLSLLSGGERALTAIALLFAILKLKPAAFCILDEIESALDETNVANFAEYVRNYSDDTQFILITHRRGSMAVCDSIYGVAMEEKGVSKVVSAKFTQTA